ncbi:two-component system, LytT family, sensor kinase [Malonomonas rubra DSM 5091]|uniref:histidine kinase n=1 Tax=Malonomonas rubra DSM 5091 TaxID=1122189 RepID=A0A1M6I9B9_MALRU|nr:sensor histidine kinase [Malonomonas rubra]SHJ30948.1 two-component system, LytT family, sensor kinase [Malonomonas rubra DSM 5091]
MDLTISLLRQLSVFLVIAYLFSKSPAFKPLTEKNLQPKSKLLLFAIFTGFSVLGIYTELPVEGAIANTGAIGAVLAGLIGGPVLGSAVGGTAALHLFILKGNSALVYVVSTGVAGLFGGLANIYLLRQNKPDQVFSPKAAFLATFGAEALQMLIILMMKNPFSEAWALVKVIALPMMIANPIGSALFMSMMRDQKSMFDKVGALFSAKAFNIADRSLGILSKGFNAESAKQLAEIIYDETGVGAVSISDGKKILAYIGIGDDHHLPGLDIVSPQTLEAVRDNKVIFADGVHEHFQCAISDSCQLGSALIVPLRVENEVVGTIKLYEPKNKLFLNLNKTLGEGIAKLLGEQLLRDRYRTQRNLLVKSELKLIQAQVNPHFLFNALNTIIAIVRNDPEQARSLLRHLSNFFRKNLKRSGDLSSLEEELDHVNSYLVIERARFGDRLQVIEEIDPELLQIKIPTFTLQPIVENAVKHGISNLLDAGVIKISAGHSRDRAIIAVEDNAGCFCDKLDGDGLGMNIVDKRIKNLYGNQYGIQTECVPDQVTRVALVLPFEERESK